MESNTCLQHRYQLFIALPLIDSILTAMDATKVANVAFPGNIGASTPGGAGAAGDGTEVGRREKLDTTFGGVFVIS